VKPALLKSLPKSLVENLRRYAAPFEANPPELFAAFPGGGDPVFPFARDSDRGLGVLLLAAALYRPGAESAAARLITGLYRRFGNDIFKLNRIPFETLRDEVEALGGVRDDAERARVPGILRSVCDFFYRVGPLGPWLATAPDWEARVMELCGEIYWMGRQSLMRNKARYFLWMVSLSSDAPAYLQAGDFAGPVGEGHLRFYIDFMKPAARPGGARAAFSADRADDAEDRLRTFRDFARLVFPDAPWKLFAPLDAYLRRGGDLQYRCRSVQRGCRPCPLASGCPAAAHFLAIER
jgi:hypothetical protein